MKPIRAILHHSLTADSKTVSWQAIRTYHTSYRYNSNIVTPTEAYILKREGKKVIDPWDDIGYSYGLEKISDHYEILTGRMMNERGAHTYGHNHNSIGICLIGNYDITPVPEELWQLTLRLVNSLCEVCNIPKSSVYGHTEFASYKTCPGKLFDMSRFRRELLQL